MATMMYPVFQSQYSSNSSSSSFGYTNSAQPFLVESLPMDASFSFSQSLQHPFLSALQVPLPTVPEELRCQYSSKRCENRRTNKKSGGLHKFCAVHREKANRNQMRLDHRRRVLKRLAQREQRSNSSTGTPTSASGGSPSRRRRSSVSRTNAAADDEYILQVEDDLDIDLMPLALHSQNAGANAQSSSTFDPQDLRILEVLLFSDEDKNEGGGDEAVHTATPVCHGECCGHTASPTTTAASKKSVSAWPTTTLQL